MLVPEDAQAFYNANLGSIQLDDSLSKPPNNNYMLEYMEAVGYGTSVTFHQILDNEEHNPELDYIELDKEEVEELTKFLLGWLEYQKADHI